MTNIINVQELMRLRDTASSKLIEETGMFFAFSQNQFDESKTPLAEGDKYMVLGSGTYIPERNFEKYMEGSTKILQDFTKAVDANNLREEYIAYELANHEAWYTYEIEDTKSRLIGTYTDAEIWSVFNKYKEVNC